MVVAPVVVVSVMVTVVSVLLCAIGAYLETMLR